MSDSGCLKAQRSAVTTKLKGAETFFHVSHRMSICFCNATFGLYKVNYYETYGFDIAFVSTYFFDKENWFDCFQNNIKVI